jgi:3-deoxy-D-manno-octulosonate 8-phosphate phosphatase (KDO 8-P phosphatase)
MHTDTFSRLRFFAFDSDGVLFPNTVWEGTELSGEAFRPKIRSYYDGQGLSLLRALGFRLCIITNEKGAHAAGVRSAIAKWNALPSSQKSPDEGGWPPIELFEGCGGRRKLEILEKWLSTNGGTLEECGAMGDDLVDVPMLQAVAFSASPRSAEKAVRDICDFVSERSGGEGAVRDLANHLVAAFGKDPLELPYE